MHQPLEIHLEGLALSYGAVRAVDGVTLKVPAGAILALLGPSGCGKTSLLRMVAGLIQPTRGQVYFGGAAMSKVSPHRRNVGFVFQDYALFPHLSVAGNIGFGMRMRGISRREADPRIDEVLDLLQIGALRNSQPMELSGGQQQRVALARSLVVEPAVLLLDEPLSALDRQLRDAMRHELRKLLKTVNITTMIVTHDQDEALALADEIVVMRSGRIEQQGTPREIYGAPRTRFVAGFIGDSNFLRCRLVARDGEALIGALPSGEQIRCPSARRSPPDGDFEIAIRPEHVVLVQAPPADGANVLAGVVSSITYLGSSSSCEIMLRCGERFNARLPSSASVSDEPQIGDAVFVAWMPDHTAVIEA
jgi:putative spermidine/putrescine transport system ATP-binding protein